MFAPRVRTRFSQSRFGQASRLLKNWTPPRRISFSMTSLSLIRLSSQNGRATRFDKIKVLFPDSGSRATSWVQIYLAVAITTSATLLLELSLTRIFSVVFYYHFAFL